MESVFKKLVSVIFFTLFHIDAKVLVNDPYYCFSQDPEQSQVLMFDNVTPYEAVRDQAIVSNVSKCTPSRFWFLGRHGLRFPSHTDHDNLFSEADTISSDIIENYELSRTTLCPLDAELIRNWKLNPNFTLSSSADLTDSGWNGIVELGKRMQKAFPTLLPKQYSSHYFFRRSPSPRTFESARAFAEGLFGRNNIDAVTYEGGKHPDNFLLPFYGCPLWSSFFFNFPEADVFKSGPEYQRMVKQVSSKLGFHGSGQLNASAVDKLATHCKYEIFTNQNSSKSAFCSAFSKANHQVIEYYNDLKSYYNGCGYGRTDFKRLIENMSCYLLQSMLKFLQSDDLTDHKATISFGHDVTLKILFVALGLFKDKTPLTATNFAQQTSRKWKTSFLTPMAANLAIIRFDCVDGDNDILFLHNEKPLKIPGCKLNGVCKQSLIMQRYRRFLNGNCDAMFCSNSI